MSLTSKTTAWVQQGIISIQQQQDILAFERTHANKTFWNTAFIFSGVLIGLGVCLLIAANWNVLPASVKLTGDFILLGGLICATYYSMQKQHRGLRELFTIFSFLLIGGTIGLIGQVFQLSGGWNSFALTWALLGLPFVILSRSRFVNMGWLVLLISAGKWEWVEHIFDNLSSMALAVVVLHVLYAPVLKFAKAAESRIVLPRAVAVLLLWTAYGVVYWMAGWNGLHKEQFLAYLFVFGFLGFRMYLAVKEQDVKSFKRNAILTEVYLFLIFAFKMGSLWLSGFGFIGGGVLLLLFIWVLRKTSRYIKKMEAFQ